MTASMRFALEMASGKLDRDNAIDRQNYAGDRKPVKTGF